MSREPGSWFERPLARTAAILALLAYLPALTAAPGRMPSDSKLYLYFDPARFFGDAASTFDGRQFAGWVPHQHIAYLWPATPWFWSFDTLGVPDWIAHRLWIGTILLAAGLGVRWCGRLLGLGAMAAFTAAIVYQLSLYVLPYISRTSVMLLPWAGLGWIVAFTIRATRRNSWADPAAIALIVLTVGAVNATALAMIVPGPVLWLLHAAWAKSVSWRDAVVVALRTGVLSLGVSLWWIAMLVIQGRYGTDVLPYSESLADVSLTATAPETWRGLGYWLFYVRDPYAATTTESLRYLSSTISIGISYLLPLASLAALVWVRWAHRRFAAALIGVGLVLAVGVHPVDDRSPLMRLLAGDDDSGLALALRSSTRALPLTMLGLALAVAMAVDAAGALTLPRVRVPTRWLTGGAVAMIAVVNLPSLWTGAFVDPALERDQDPPSAWTAAVDALDESGDGGRVLQLPGAEFGAYRWGYTVDQPLPGLTDKPLVTRDLLPLGSTGAMDLLFALDDRLQDGVLEPESLAPIARMLGVDTIWLTNDIAFDRFRTARPEIVRAVVDAAPGMEALVPYGEIIANRPDVPMTDEHSMGDPRVGEPTVRVELAGVSDPGRIIRAAAETVIVSGSGDGLVDAAAAGLLDPARAAVRYSADLGDGLEAALDDAIGIIVTDSNRDRARHWRSSQDTTGFTEQGGPEQDVLRPAASDARLDLFATEDSQTQTIATQRGPVTAWASAYGEPFAYLPEHRPFMAIDGDRSTAWLVGEHGEPVGETLRIAFETPVSEFTLHQPPDDDVRRITGVTFATDAEADGSSGFAELGDASWNGVGQLIDVGAPFTSLDVTIDTVAGGTPFTGSAVAPVGFVEVETRLGSAVEVVRPPVDTTGATGPDTPLAVVLTRLRADPMDRWRDDPEPALIRELDLGVAREFGVELTGRLDARASDAELATLLGWPASASSRLTGSLRHAGVAALDGDPDTAWITAFDEAAGATLTIARAVGTEPIADIELVQPVAGVSRITSVTVRSGGEERTVSVAPDDTGRARVQLEPPLPAGSLEIVLAAVDREMTIDRRFGDPVALPAAISEISFNGRPDVPPLAETSISLPCRPIGVMDGQIVAASIEITGAGWLDGGPIGLEPCEPSLSLDAGSHLMVLDTPDLPVTIDRVVFDGAFRQALDQAETAPGVAVVESGRFDRSISVDACPVGCWVVLGEGRSEAWTASSTSGPLGVPELIDGGFNGWWLSPTDGPTEIDIHWTAQRELNWALLLSAIIAAVAVALIVWSWRSRPPSAREVHAPAEPRPRFDSSSPRPTVRTVAATALAWVVIATLLIGPDWAVAGALGGLLMFAVRSHRTVELAALASLLVVAAAVVVRERRVSPLPNGGWPGTFDSLHGLGMFAIACVLVAALTADDAGSGEVDGKLGDDSTDRDNDGGVERATPASTIDG